MFEILYEPIGTKPVIRNFIIDYHDEKRQSFFKPLQIVITDLVTDEEIVANIIKEQKDQGHDVYGVVEVYGKHTLNELKALAESLDISKYKLRPLFFDRDKAIE
ncbi:MAG: hypothetical protein ACOYIF_07280 [Acetivibrionales bacterium]|jgi:hypothetical protein